MARHRFAVPLDQMKTGFRRQAAKALRLADDRHPVGHDLPERSVPGNKRRRLLEDPAASSAEANTFPTTCSRDLHPSPKRRRRVAGQLVAVTMSMLGAALLLVVALASPALAQGPAEETIGEIVERLRMVILGAATTVAALFATIAGFRLFFGGEDPVQIEKAKTGLRATAIGYAIVILAATVLVPLLSYVIEG